MAERRKVRIRCYRQGLGDSFLLTFPRSGKGKPFQMLIDCGVLLGTPKEKEKMLAVASDIEAATGGRLDLVVATHEHWDHVCGFRHAREVFDRLTVGRVWQAWTEDPADGVAQRLRRERADAGKAVRALAQKLEGSKGLSAFGMRMRDEVRSLVSFLGPLRADGDSADLSGAGEALDYLRRRGNPRGASKPVVEFHRPGELAELEGVTGVRVHVLGPPRDTKLLKRSKPSGRAGEVYELFFGLGPTDSLMAALGEVGDGLRPVGDLSQPFDSVHRRALPLPSALPQAGGYPPPRSARFFQEHYLGEGDDWRRIDTDWLLAGGGLALQLDSATNNTSLALAIELLPSGRVLLFPADAQVGSWQSWHDLSWERAPKLSGTGPVRMAELLGRTVFYKVGHHGSHNATLRERGLEMMTHPDLCAVVPVEAAMARRQGWDRMPLESLVGALRDRTRGRVWFTVEDAERGLANPSRTAGGRIKATVAKDFMDFEVPFA